MFTDARPGKSGQDQLRQCRAQRTESISALLAAEVAAVTTAPEPCRIAIRHCVLQHPVSHGHRIQIYAQVCRADLLNRRQRIAVFSSPCAMNDLMAEATWAS